MRQTKGSSARVTWFFYGTLVASYFLANLTRSSTGVAMPSLALSMGMGASTVGLVTSLYFYAYTMMQPVSGMMCDRKGPLLSCGMGLLLLSVGIAVFAFAPSPFFLGVGRFLSGLGAAAAFNGTLVYQANAFPRERYAVLAATSVTIGHFGGVVAVTPLGMMLDAWGRGGAFGIIAAAALLLGMIMLFGHRRDPVLARKRDESLAAAKPPVSVWSGFRMLASSRPLMVITAVWSSCLSLQMTLVALWGVSWLSQGCGLPVHIARRSMSLVGIGVMVGAQLGGWIGTRFRGSRNALVTICAGVSISLLGFLAATSVYPQPWLLSLLSLVLGIFLGACNVTCNSNLNETVDREVIGSAVGAVNTVIFLSVMLCQFASGIVLGFFKGGSPGSYSLSGYLTVFFLILLVFGVSVLPLLRIRSFRRERSTV